MLLFCMSIGGLNDTSIKQDKTGIGKSVQAILAKAIKNNKVSMDFKLY